MESFMKVSDWVSLCLSAVTAFCKLFLIFVVTGHKQREGFTTTTENTRLICLNAQQTLILTSAHVKWYNYTWSSLVKWTSLFKRLEDVVCELGVYKQNIFLSLSCVAAGKKLSPCRGSWPVCRSATLRSAWSWTEPSRRMPRESAKSAAKRETWSSWGRRTWWATSSLSTYRQMVFKKVLHENNFWCKVIKIHEKNIYKTIFCTFMPTNTY